MSIFLTIDGFDQAGYFAKLMTLIKVYINCNFKFQKQKKSKQQA